MIAFCTEVTVMIELLFSQGARIAIKLRDTFMQLNRAVCIDMPEARVPWFHEKYCEEIAVVGKRFATSRLSESRTFTGIFRYFQRDSLGPTFTTKYLKPYRIYLEQTVLPEIFIHLIII